MGCRIRGYSTTSKGNLNEGIKNGEKVVIGKT